MATPGGLVDKQELIDAQLDTAHLGRVVNSKDASGAPISTSTNRTGGVNKTLDALEAGYQEAIDNAQVENYAGLWPNTGGIATKGETWQTQAGGAPTGRYFRSLRDTAVSPNEDDINWREIVSVTYVDTQNAVQDAVISELDGRVDVNEADIITLREGQQSGVIVFQTFALLSAYAPQSSEERGSFKVTNDPIVSLNGYYSWLSGTTYTQDTSLVTGVIDENNTSEAVSGAAVFNHVAPTVDRVWRVEKRLDKDWWTFAETQPIALYDLGYDEGFTASGGLVTSITELSGNGGSLLPSTGSGTLDSINGHAAVMFDGGSTVRAYSGLNSGLKELFKEIPYSSFSLHHIARLDDVSQDMYMISGTVGDAISPGIWSHTRSNGTHNTILNSSDGVKAISSGPVYSYSNGEVSIKSHFVNGDDESSFCVLNGDINALDGIESLTGTPTPLNLDTFNLGNVRSGQPTGGVIGAVSAAAMYAGKTHTRKEVRDIHAGLLEKYLPAALDDIFTVFGYGQSNTAANYPNPNPVVFPDGDAYAWGFGDNVLTKTNVGHATFGTNTASVVWFAQELQKIIGGKPLIGIRGSGGLALAGGGIGGSSAYLEPETESGILALATSSYKVNSYLFQDFADLTDLTPRFKSERFRTVLWIGCETDVANVMALAVNGTVPQDVLDEQTQNIARALDNTITRFRSDFGYTSFALVLTGRRGSTLSEVQFNSQGVNAVNDAYKLIAASRDDVHIVYEHTPDFNDQSFQLDDLVVGTDGEWLSGMGSVDGVHYTFDQYKAIGITGARN
ncbi:hypothetical protein NVP1022O_97, partial [Vibrio phage 1.022.O._10N.286.45.A10]